MYAMIDDIGLLMASTSDRFTQRNGGFEWTPSKRLESATRPVWQARSPIADRNRFKRGLGIFDQRISLKSHYPVKSCVYEETFWMLFLEEMPFPALRCGAARFQVAQPLSHLAQRASSMRMRSRWTLSYNASALHSSSFCEMNPQTGFLSFLYLSIFASFDVFTSM